MKAVRFHGRRDIRLDNVEIVQCGRGQVKVGALPRFESAKISILSESVRLNRLSRGYVEAVLLPPCSSYNDETDSIGSDLHEYLGGASLIPTSPHPITNEKVPLTLGHEFSGTIEEVGEDVYDIKVGSRVAVQPIIYDGTCNACKEGYINCCDNNGFVGISGKASQFTLNLY